MAAEDSQGVKERPVQRRVQEIEVSVAQVKQETPDTTTLFLKADDGPMEYTAGHFLTIDPHQFGQLEHFIAYLEGLKGQREKPRAYSLASAPHEPYVAITIKEERYISDETPYPPLLSPLLAYYLPKGARLVIKGFTGAYTLTEDILQRAERIVHVCAGSGIVPNLSLIKDSLQRGDSLQHILLYSNKTREDTIFFSDFEALRQQRPEQLKVVHCITRQDPSSIPGARRGRITEETLREFIPDPSRAFAFSCGPGITPYERKAAKAAGEDPVPRFVENMVALLQQVGLDKKQIKQESWG